MVVCSVSVVPLGTRTPSVSKCVAGCIQVLKQSGLKYQLTPMATIIEGELEEVLDVIAKMHRCVFSEQIKRVVTHITIDERRDKTLTMKGKVAAVTEKLG